MLAYFQLCFLSFWEQISNSFIVDLENTNFDLEGAAAIFIIIDFLENSIADDGNESLVSAIPDHRVGFARSCLPICE